MIKLLLRVAIKRGKWGEMKKREKNYIEVNRRKKLN